MIPSPGIWGLISRQQDIYGISRVHFLLITTKLGTLMFWRKLNYIPAGLNKE